MHVATRIDVGEEHLVGGLIEDACNTKDEDGPRIAEHVLQQLTVQLPAEGGILRYEAQGEHDGTYQVDIEGITHVVTVHHGEVDDVQQDAHDNVQQFQQGKLEGFLLLAQVGKGNAQEGIDSHRNSHHTNIRRMLAVAHQRADRLQEAEHRHGKKQRYRAYADKRRSIDRLRVGMRLVSKTEIRGLHAEGQQYKHQGYISIDVRNDAVASAGSRELRGIERH